MYLNVYSTYDDTYLMSGTPQEIADEFECSVSSVYKMRNKVSREKDFYCTDDKPIPHTVYDVYDTDTWELVSTVLTYQEAVSRGYFKSNYSAMMNSRGSLHRRAYGGYRIQERMSNEPPKTYNSERISKFTKNYIANALLR